MRWASGAENASYSAPGPWVLSCYEGPWQVHSRRRETTRSARGDSARQVAGLPGRCGCPGDTAGLCDQLRNYKAWCDRHGFDPMPAAPEVGGAYLAAAGEGYALPTLRRRVAAMARSCGVAGHPLDTKHPAIRETLRGIGRKHGASARRVPAPLRSKGPRSATCTTRSCFPDQLVP